MVSKRPKRNPHMINDAGKVLSEEKSDELFQDQQLKDVVDEVMELVIDRILSRETYDAIIYQLEESYNIKADATDLTPQLIQEEIINSIYREHFRPHIRQPNQNEHIYNKVKK